ncbi:hypothetical protein [Novosphingobium sp. 11B]
MASTDLERRALKQAYHPVQDDAPRNPVGEPRRTRKDEQPEHGTRPRFLRPIARKSGKGIAGID